jgi:GxxExxY protein
MEDHEELTGQIIGAAMRVHAVLGPGMLERAYQICLAYELRKRGMAVRTEVPMTLIYDGVELDLAYRLDMIVEESVAVEVKAIAKLLPVHKAQLLSQVRVANLRVGLLMNFHEESLKNGVQRVVNRR